MKKIISVVAMAIALSSCRPTYAMKPSHSRICKPVRAPSDLRGWDYIGRNATISGYGEWYDAEGNFIGYALEEDSTIYKFERCM